MGRAGIRRREPAHRLPKVEGHLDPAEQARMFGSFRWGAYAPAGSLERFGFMTRQVARRHRGEPFPRWRDHELHGFAIWLLAVMAGIVVVAVALDVL
ncbi:MAG: hypothetical protein ACXVJ7_02090 [Acidimicrobiia bacterium]